jgi:predicted transcriptional regulator of viral defense system
MLKSTENQIIDKIKKAKRGTLFFVENFIKIANAKTANKALERLVKSGELERLATGIYYRPATSNLIGKLTPSLEAVANAIAKRDRARIVPTGAYALNRLGLSSQVPMKIVYLTDGSARKIKIGKQTIAFKKATPKNVAAVGEISSLVIQALKTIGKDKVLDKEIKHIQELLKKEKSTRLEHDIRLAPAWIREIMLPVLKQLENEQK